MFNTPILDVAIGLAFVFLLYSFLITAIKEAIATTCGLRAKMLRKGIVNGMLSDTPEYGEWKGVFYSIRYNVIEFFALFKKEKEEKNKNKLGQKFYNHPMIKNYGSNEFYPHPSYIPGHNFSTVLIDILRNEFDVHADKIVTGTETVQQLKTLSDGEKIKRLLEHYEKLHFEDNETENKRRKDLTIDQDTLVMIKMLLTKAGNNMDEFSKHLENWFDDSMNRVTGWYKRQTQFILIILGLLAAVIFNVDTIEIAKRLSKDKDLREQLIQSATAYSQSHPQGVAGSSGTNTTTVEWKHVHDKWRKVDSLINNDIKDVNSLLAIGWGDFGALQNANLIIHEYPYEYKHNFDSISKNNITAKKNPAHSYKNIIRLHGWVLQSIYNEHWIKLKVGYVLRESTRAKKFLGFLLTAMAISLGSPFWFDLLNKLINLRGAGKKENESKDDKEKSDKPSEIKINVNNDKEALG
jgi:hypothetical protein